MKKTRMSDESKVVIALFICVAVIIVGIVISVSYTNAPRQFGDKVCIKIAQELKCEPITPTETVTEP